jgi:hypothetical protein
VHVVRRQACLVETALLVGAAFRRLIGLEAEC